MADPVDVPRPVAAGPSDFSERVRALRGDARIGAAVLACVAIAAGVAWFRAGIAPSAPTASATAGERHGVVDRDRRRRRAPRPRPRPAPAAIVVDVVGAVRAAGCREPAGRRARDRRDPRGGRRDARAPTSPGSTSRRSSPTARGSRCPSSGSRRPPSIPAAVSGSAEPATGTGTDTAAGAGGADQRQHRNARPARGAAGHRAHARRRDRAGARAQRRRSAASTTSTACPASATGGCRSCTTSSPSDVDELGVVLGLGAARARASSRANGPGPRRPALLLAVGVVALAARVVRRGRVRASWSRSLALAMLGGAQTQRALHGLAHSTFTAAIERGAPATISGVLVDDPQPGRFDTTAYRARRRRAARTGRCSSWPRATTRCALRVLEAGDRVVLRGRLGPLHPSSFEQRAKWRHAVGRFDRVEVLGLEPARGALRRRERVCAASCCAAPHRSRPTQRALLAGFLLGDTRAVPDDTVRRVPRVGPVAPARGVGGERRVHARAVRAAAAPPPARRAHRRRARHRAAVRDDDALRAVGAARVGARGGGVGVVVRRAGPRRACARSPSRSSRCSCSTRSSCTPSRSGSRAARARASRCCPARCAPASRGRAWLRNPLAVSLAAQVGRHAGAARDVRIGAGGHAARQPARGARPRRRSACTGCSRARSAAWCRRSRRCCSSRRRCCIAWITAVARAGAAVGVDLDRRAALVRAGARVRHGGRGPADAVAHRPSVASAVVPAERVPDDPPRRPSASTCARGRW